MKQRCITNVQRCVTKRGNLPDLTGDFGDEAYFAPLLGFRQRIPLFRGGKSALWAKADLLFAT